MQGAENAACFRTSTVHEVSSLLMRLNMATRSSHADVDEPWLSLLRSDVTRTAYISVLARTYGFIAPFESACKYTPGVERDVDIRQLSRAGLLAHDLLSLGLEPSQVTQIPHCPRITTFGSLAEALGWIYVVERSTLLFDGIRRHLLRHAPWAAQACVYLSAYDGTVGENWSAFGRRLDRVGAKPDVADEIVEASQAAFACATEWFRTRARRSTDETDHDRPTTRMRPAR